MNAKISSLPAAEIRKILLAEIKKFALALEYGSTISDLEEIRAEIKNLSDLLLLKEKEESGFKDR